MPRPDPADKIIDGTNSDNMILGTSAAETVNGLGGSDKIYGGGGNDILTGGAGEDYFTFDTALNASGNVDRITDINVDDDTIRLHDAVFSKLTREGALKSSWFEAGTKADDSNDYVIYDQGTGKLYYDADGTGSGAAVQFAMIENRANLTAASFLVL
jgi:Ca2+-binding RTX toxin-like protein